ncbi:MAG: hypothetical protein M1824_000955 [Vezdaea acicularis]|nr:MAG: hypothetical protein M1824_000955 [Vezdaea acicularis]
MSTQATVAAAKGFPRIRAGAGREALLARGYWGRGWGWMALLTVGFGSGIRECEVIQWFVEPDARVEQFDKLCEVQSDKASVEVMHTTRCSEVGLEKGQAADDEGIDYKPLRWGD